MQGMLIYKVIPTYPVVAQAIRASGTVVLQATISRDGSDRESARGGGAGDVAAGGARCGEAMALRPYMLNGQPVEVETTVDVQFKLE